MITRICHVIKTLFELLSVKARIIFVGLVSLFLLYEFSSLFVSDSSGKCKEYSPAYPSLGGPGCSPECTEREGVKNSSYAAVFWGKNYELPQDLIKNMEHASSILKKYGKPDYLNIEKGKLKEHKLHMAFDYYCCYTEAEAVRIGRFVNKYEWRSVDVWFDRMVCAIHGHKNMVSIVLMLDRKSQHELTRQALKNERELEAMTGVRKHIPHTKLQDFHMTLATINQSSVPVMKAAVEEINQAIPPGKWHKTPVVLRRPVCYKCDRVIENLIRDLS